MYIEQLYTGCLAEAAYYLESEGEAAVIDPLRETSPYLLLAERRGATIQYVFETHFHADFVSGHIDLAKKTGATIIYGPQAETTYEVYHAKDQEVFQLGKVTIKALHTPGHTPESTCYLLFDEEGKEHAIFTGDTLFVGDVGRPDLLDGIMTKETLAGMLYDSLHTKIKPLSDHVLVYPAHGPGSTCGKNIGKETFSTIGIQKQCNYALQEMRKEEFIKKVTANIFPPPPYFFQDAMINKKGYTSIDQVMAQNLQALSLEAFRKVVEEGAQVLDTRTPDKFEKGFIPRALNVGLNGQYAIWVGTLVDIHTPLVLVTEEGKEEESVRRLARIGYEQVRGYLKGGMATWKNAGMEMHTIMSVAVQAIPPLIKEGFTVLDVRKEREYTAGHVKNALHYPLASLREQANELSPKKPYLIYCAGGYRSMIAASILKTKGYHHLKNVLGGFKAIRETTPLVLSSGF